MIINEEKLKSLYLVKGKQVETKVEKIDWRSDEKYRSNTYVIIEKIVQKYNGVYHYSYIVQCIKCGDLKKIYTGDWVNQKNRRCKKCLSIERRYSHVGYENNTYKVIGVNVERSNQNGRKVYYDVICKNCGAHLILRWDAIQYDTKNGKCCKCCGNNKIPNSNSLFNISYNQYKQNAIMRGFSFDLTKEEFCRLITSNCHYCNGEPIEIESLKRYNRTGKPIYMNGIDRVDSNKGYTIENSVPCCVMCNRMKLNYSLEQFYEHIEKIYNYHKSLTTIPDGSTSEANADGSGECPNKDDDIV